MNVVLVIVDSLRADFLHGGCADAPPTAFFDSLRDRSISFRRTYATECWTLPTHASIFTGLMPSEHGAHFQSLACTTREPRLASRLAADGLFTELVTRNSVLDGSIPGLTDGFARNTPVFSDRSIGFDPLALMLAFSKPRFRRQIRQSGFFSALQREQRAFVMQFARAMLPADAGALEVLTSRMHELRSARSGYFLVANLYDVHAPYSPSETSLFAPMRSIDAVIDNVRALRALPDVGSHAYLREGFSMPESRQRTLRQRYARAVELMDRKLAKFFDDVRERGLADDACFIVTSDHGEAFGEHGLFLHDASVYDVHLHVPLFICHPRLEPRVVDRTISTRALNEAILAIARDEPLACRLLAGDDEDGGMAMAEHFHYPHLAHTAERYLRNQATVLAGRWKVVLRGRDVPVLFDLESDPGEEHAHATTWEEFSVLARDAGASERAVEESAAWLRRWAERQPA